MNVLNTHLNHFGPHILQLVRLYIFNCVSTQLRSRLIAQYQQHASANIMKMKIHSGCEMADFVKTHILVCAAQIARITGEMSSLRKYVGDST